MYVIKNLIEPILEAEQNSFNWPIPILENVAIKASLIGSFDVRAPVFCT